MFIVDLASEVWVVRLLGLIKLEILGYLSSPPVACICALINSWWEASRNKKFSLIPWSPLWWGKEPGNRRLWTGQLTQPSPGWLNQHHCGPSEDNGKSRHGEEGSEPGAEVLLWTAEEALVTCGQQGKGWRGCPRSRGFREEAGEMVWRVCG